MNQQDKRPISDYQLERYLLREGTDDELADLERRLADDPELAQRLAALERSNEELHQRYPPEWMRGQIELKLKRLRPELSRRAQGRRVQRTWSGYRLWAVPAVALILAVVAVPTLLDQETSEAPATRIKGGEQEPRLLVFRKLASGVERLQDGALARSGDLVQLAYRSGGLQYGAILSVDGRGTVTQHLPTTGAEAVPLAAQDTLDVAYELDAAPRWERFYLVAADRRFGLAEVKTKLAADDVALGDDIRLFRFTVKKPREP
ncbi:MAG: ActD-like protein [Gemmatimonadetes bacterium]|nr:ActD-like protein [Gemmatimonadota bacterium]MXY84076.1 ActD-like protein [Gemmatimonadota bacterium]MYB69075.1 ActD-like protein [Gemmatimonadota bacterium]